MYAFYVGTRDVGQWPGSFVTSTTAAVRSLCELWRSTSGGPRDAGPTHQDRVDRIADVTEEVALSGLSADSDCQRRARPEPGQSRRRDRAGGRAGSLSPGTKAAAGPLVLVSEHAAPPPRRELRSDPSARPEIQRRRLRHFVRADAETGARSGSQSMELRYNQT